jgi:hypothetical protein
MHGDGRMIGFRLEAVPELDQRAECRTRRDERGLVVARFEQIDDAHAAALQRIDGAIELGRLDREVVQPLAAFVDEALDEAARPGALDDLELEVADVEIAPGVVAGVARLTLVHHHDGKVSAKERQRGVGVPHGDREMIDAHRRRLK